MTAPKRAEIEAQIIEIEKQLSAMRSGLVSAWLWSPIGKLASDHAAHAALARVGLSLALDCVCSVPHRTPMGKNVRWWSFIPEGYQPPEPWQRVEIPDMSDESSQERWVHPDLLGLDY